MKANVKENQMKATPNSNNVVFAAILACLIAVGSGRPLQRARCFAT